MLIGFIHGVMNTDNMSISGETIDYGPCAFMEAFDPAKVFSFIDHQGRYCYSNQPHAAHWNLARLAEALLPLLEMEAGEQNAGRQEVALASAHEALVAFGPQFEAAYLAGMRRKLGLFTEREGDAVLAQDLLKRMAANHADYTLTFRRLCDAVVGPEGRGGVRTLFLDPGAYDAWAVGWRQRLEVESVPAQVRAARMRTASPVFIPRNHLVEAVIDSAVNQQDFRPFEELLDVVSRPYEDRPHLDRFATPARPEECVTATFCGT
jgi:uncharacterized protein YdiU (UPF0061 family)